MTSGSPTRSSTATTGTVAIIGSAVGFGLGPLLATKVMATGISPEGTGLLRVAPVLVTLLPVAPQLRHWRRGAVLSALGGAVNALGIVAFYAALERAPVAAATVVYYTYPLFVLALSALVLKRPTRRSEWSLGAMILAGTLMTAGASSLSPAAITALLMAMAAPAAWSIYLLLLSGPLADVPTLPKLLAGTSGSTLVLLSVSLGTGGVAVPVSWDAAVPVALLAVCSLGVPAALVTWGAPRAGERATALVGSVELVVALLAGWLFLSGGFTSWQAMGAAVVLLASTAAARAATSR